MEAEARFREMFESTYPVVVRYARHRGFSGQDVEDLVAATYEVAWRRFEQVPAGREALPWLLTVTLNHARNRRRKLSRDRQLVQRLTPPEHPLAPTDQAPYDWTEIRRALDRLTAADRELMLLVAWDGLGPAEAGAVLGLTPAAARTRLHRARARLGAFLHDTDRAGAQAPARSPAGPTPARRPS
jgi:RNA polymerase sigma-70 factor (ECF subfamily)